MPARVDQSPRENVLSLNKDIEEAFNEVYGLQNEIETLRRLDANDEADTKLEGYKAALINLSNLQRERHHYEEEWVRPRLRHVEGELKAIRLGARRS